MADRQVFASIEDFIVARWVEGKEVLRRLDSSYVATAEATRRMVNTDFVLPSSIHTDVLLPDVWVKVLESCTDVQMQIEALKTSVELLRPSRYQGLDAEEIGRVAYYHGTSWVLHAYALAEKTKMLITRTCDLLPSDTSAGALMGLMEPRYRGQVQSQVTRILARGRTPLTHGVGGVGLMARGVTGMSDGWTVGLAFQIRPADFMRSANEGNATRVGRWFGAKKRQTAGMLERLGAILAEFESERNEIIARDAQ